jgi:hypothetical protein
LRQPEIRLWAAVIASWVVSILLLLISPSWAAGIALTVLVLLGPVAVMSLRYRSLELGLYAVVAWHVHAFGFLIGLVHPRRDLASPIEGRIVSDGRVEQPIDHGRTTAS